MSLFNDLLFYFDQLKQTSTKAGSHDAVSAVMAKPVLRTDRQRSFYRLLCRVVGNGNMVWVNPRIFDVCLLLNVSEGTPAAFEHRRTSVSFLICDVNQMRPRLAVHLDLPDAKVAPDQQDKFDSMLRSVGLPAIRFDQQADLSDQSVRTRILDVLDVKETLRIDPSCEPSQQVPAQTPTPASNARLDQ